jgi:hypothetical protein
VTEAIQSAPKPTAAQAAAATDDDVISQDTEDAVHEEGSKIAADKGNNKRS